MATKKSEVAVQQSQELAFSQEVPDYIKQGQARGSEEVGVKDIALPRLEIVQSQSPIKDLVEGVVEGHMFNSVTQELLGDLVYFVPVYYRMEYLVWKDQDKGGGFFGSFPSEAEAEARKHQAVEEGEDPDDIEVIDTPVHYGLMVTPDCSRVEQLVISMPRTKAKVSRKWNSMIQLAGGDRFSRVYKISTFKDENKNKQKFFNYVVQPAGFTPKAVYEEAERNYELFKAGAVRAAHETVIDNAGGEGHAATGRGEV